MNEEDLQADLANFLQKTFGEDDIFIPREIHVAKWRTDPRFCGAYSFTKVNTFNERPVKFHWLQAPCGPQGKDPTLFFAGEAYDYKYSGSITGAFNNGRDVAIKIIDQFNK